jgi:hypothetical protein
MKSVIRLEECGIFLFSLYLFSTLDYPWWLFPLLLFVPDISMVGYLGGTRLGAILYNILHFRALALLLFVGGTFVTIPPLSLVGVILFAHASLDRALGYGLKYGDSFSHTHLGMIGKNAEPTEETVV